MNAKLCQRPRDGKTTLRQEHVSLQPIRCLRLSGPMSPAVSLQSCWRQNTECSSHHAPLDSTRHDILLPPPPIPQSPSPFLSPSPQLAQVPKGPASGHVPSPWKHIPASGSYTQRKGQTLSGKHMTLEEHADSPRGSLQSSVTVQPIATIPP